MKINNFILWNCNKIENNIEELFYTLYKENIDTIALNETKLDTVGAAYFSQNAYSVCVCVGV